MKTTVVVTGASGMLGSMVLQALAESTGMNVVATTRGPIETPDLGVDVAWRTLDAQNDSDADLAAAVRGADWIVNCIGVIKPYIHDDNATETERALKVNGLFPYRLAHIAAQQGARILQIATDCVYSGSKGDYREDDPHDALDVYGKSKSLGEVCLPHVHSLRCSIIGPEQKAYVSLLEWFLRQPQNAEVNGFTNHRWNGVTTYHFGRLCRGIIEQNLELPQRQHLVPSGVVTKAEMLACFAEAFGRGDIAINPVAAQTVIDRTIQTHDQSLNEALWRAAGYPQPPSVPAMIAELAALPAAGGAR